MRASSAKVNRRCSRQKRTVRLIFHRASVLIAGRNEVKQTPCLFLALRARKVNPRNVNDVSSKLPRRLLSWQ